MFDSFYIWTSRSGQWGWTMFMKATNKWGQTDRDIMNSNSNQDDRNFCMLQIKSSWDWDLGAYHVAGIGNISRCLHV